MGGDPAEIRAAFAGVELFDLADKQEFFTDEFQATLSDGAHIARTVGLLERIPDLDRLLAPEYVYE